MTSHSCSQQRRRVFQVLHELQHKNIVKLQDAYETPSSLILVCELATGGELMHRIAEERSVYTEEEVKRHLLVMLDTIKYMHDQGARPHTAPANRHPRARGHTVHALMGRHIPPYSLHAPPPRRPIRTAQPRTSCTQAWTLGRAPLCDGERVRSQRAGDQRCMTLGPDAFTPSSL